MKQDNKIPKNKGIIGLDIRVWHMNLITIQPTFNKIAWQGQDVLLHLDVKIQTQIWDRIN